MSLLTLIAKGGWVMWILIGLFFWMLFIVIDRFNFFGDRTQPLKATDREDLEYRIREGNFEGALRSIEKNEGLAVDLVRAGLVHIKKTSRPLRDVIKEVQEVMEAEMEALSPELQKDLSKLDTISRGSPLIGLFGTVVGMIKIFLVMGGGGLGDPVALSQGIGWALMTTAGGLTIAIPAFFFHRHYLEKSNYWTLELGKIEGWFLEQLEKRITIEEVLKSGKPVVPEE